MKSFILGVVLAALFVGGDASAKGTTYDCTPPDKDLDSSFDIEIKRLMVRICTDDASRWGPAQSSGSGSLDESSTSYQRYPARVTPWFIEQTPNVSNLLIAARIIGLYPFTSDGDSIAETVPYLKYVGSKVLLSTFDQAQWRKELAALPQYSKSYEAEFLKTMKYLQEQDAYLKKIGKKYPEVEKATEKAIAFGTKLQKFADSSKEYGEYYDVIHAARISDGDGLSHCMKDLHASLGTTLKKFKRPFRDNVTVESRMVLSRLADALAYCGAGNTFMANNKIGRETKFNLWGGELPMQVLFPRDYRAEYIPNPFAAAVRMAVVEVASISSAKRPRRLTPQKSYLQRRGGSWSTEPDMPLMINSSKSVTLGGVEWVHLTLGGESVVPTQRNKVARIDSNGDVHYQRTCKTTGSRSYKLTHDLIVPADLAKTMPLKKGNSIKFLTEKTLTMKDDTIADIGIPFFIGKPTKKGWKQVYGWLNAGGFDY